MKIEIKVPVMGESISEATVGTILKESGASVEMDEELLELETDKVNQVLYAPQKGTVEYTVKPDDVVKIGQVIGFVNTKESGKQQSQPTPEQAPTPTSPNANQGARLSKEAFLEKALAKGEKPKSLIPQQAAIQAAPQPKVETAQRESRRRLSKIRKVIANRLVEAQQTTAMLTTFNEVDLSRVMELRKNYQEEFVKEYEIKLGLMSFFVKATVSALKVYPNVNSYLDGDEIVERHYYDIGIAVGTERGLIVPVVRDCDQRSFAGIEQAISDYAKKAREGTISVDDLQGGGFTITNGGVYGSLLSTPILNPPQSAILGMHTIQKRPVVVEDQIVIRPMMYLALSYDHRLIDGKEAVSFLIHIKNCLEEPSRLLIGV